MNRCLYWCFRSLGYLFFAFCAYVWINVAFGGIAILVKFVSSHLRDIAVAVLLAILGYIFMLFGRYLVALSRKFHKEI